MDLDELQRLLGPLLPGSMGVRLTLATPERVEAEMPVRPDLSTTGGIVHGGALMAFADTLGAVGTFMNLKEGQRTATIDSGTKFIAAAKVGGVVRAECVALHRGRTTQVWQTMLRDGDGRLCAVVTQTQMVIG
jgi:uncharacterized protein (TIGR00369 family)